MRVIAGYALLVLAHGRRRSASPACRSPPSDRHVRSDIQRLRLGRSRDARADIDALRVRRCSRAPSELRDELGQLRDEVTYLRVKLRKSDNVSRADYSICATASTIVRARAGGRPPVAVFRGRPDDRRLATARNRAGSDDSGPGQELDVRLQDTLSSERNQVEIAFRRRPWSIWRWTAAS